MNTPDGTPVASDKPQAYRARWILPVESPPIPNGLVVTHRGRITFVGSAPAGDTAGAWAEAALLPALVNAHTHLEFSSLAAPLGVPRMPLPDWIRQVIAWRRTRDSDPAEGERRRASAIQAGVAEVIASGTRGVGEIATSPASAAHLATAPLSSVAFGELIGLAPDRIEPLVAAAEGYLAPADGGSRVQLGLSPHAPYTVHPDLLARLVRLSQERSIPLAMHLAESQEELQLLRDGTGAFAELLQSLGAWHPDTIPPGTRPLDYLQRLAMAHRALVIHANYCSAEEQQFLADRRDRLTAVYCPRTHAFFGHEPYPLSAMLRRGVRVALGTDSRASNPDLDMLAELRFAAVRHPEVAPEQLLRMATLAGAEALGCDRELGSLRVGKRAEFLAVPLRPDQVAEPFGFLTSGAGS